MYIYIYNIGNINNNNIILPIGGGGSLVNIRQSRIPPAAVCIL